jgi:chromosomal replication initiator protein
LFFRNFFSLEASPLNVPVGALISPLSEGGFALDLGDGPTWTSRFVAGPENAPALHAIEDICTRSALPYNPLVLYGPTGIGKSHLAHGIASHVAKAQPGSSVVYETGADFARGYAEAVESHGVLAWREAHRSAALLVLDDLEQLAERVAAQIELLHTIDSLRDTAGRIVVTARGVPSRIPHILPALTSRLSAGLTVRLAAPGPATRLAVLRMIAVARDLPISEDALLLLADELAVTARELSGALHDLAAAGNSGEPIDPPAILSYLRSRESGRRATLREIATYTARYYAMHVADLRGPSRRRNIANARALAMFMARQLTGKSYCAVGKYFGGRDHTTVLHGCRKTEELMTRDTGLRQTVFELRSQLGCG